MKKIQRVLIGFLAAAVAAPSAAAPAFASAPSVIEDEAAYVNLDYYGKPEKVNVVKGCSLNGNSSFTDYGSYSKVTNMTNEAKPDLSSGGVSWKLPQGTGQFYFECMPKDQSVTLPWDFDVSYKLNGVPTEAKKLAGASGMVEIDVKATPNKNASAYYRNNLLLQVGTYVKMKDTLSVEAPGAQLQALGDYKAILFAALPGQEKTFTMRIGTKSFESDGVVMMMIPGTLDQFKDIKDLSKDKDTVKDSIDSLNTGTNQILETLEAMSAGLSGTQSGLSSLNGARATISSGKGQVYKNADKALADLSAVSKQTTALVPHLKKGQQLIQDVNLDLNALTGTITDMSPKLAALSGELSNIHTTVSDLRDNLDDLHDQSGSTTSHIDNLKRDLGDLKKYMGSLQNDMNGLSHSSAEWNTQVKNTKTNVDQLKAILAQMQKSPVFQQKISTDLTNEIVNLTGAPAPYASIIAQNILKDGALTTSSLDNLNDSSLDLSNSLNELINELGSANSGGMIDDVKASLSDIEAYMATLDDAGQNTEKLLKYSNNACTDLQGLLDSSQTMINNIKDLNHTANQYKDDSVAALKDTAALTQDLSNTLASSHAFLTSLETLMETSGNQLDNGTRQTLNGLIQLLQQSLDGVGKTSVVKNAGNKIRSTVDKEIDKIEDDSNLLNLDYEAKPVSLTSSKNPTPSSIQIVLRTDEIKKTTAADKIRDMEKAEETVSPWARICNVFSTLWKAITSLFSK